MRRIDLDADPTLFWDRVLLDIGCWIWKAGCSSDGYGSCTYRGKIRGAHRVAWALTHGGEYPEPNVEVCHTCDNPPCVRPDHLFLGTHTDNMKDASIKGRLWSPKTTHCPQGHEYTPENTRRDGVGKRCIICRRVRDREYWLRKTGNK